MENKKALASNSGESIVNAAQEAGTRVKPLRDFWTKFNNDWSFSLSAALAYGLLMAVFPFFIALVALLGVFLDRLDPQGLNSLVQQIAKILPSATSTQISSLLNAARTQLARQTGILWFVAVVLAIFNGSRLFILMEKCFDIVYHVSPRKFIAQNLVAIGMLILFIVLIPIMVFAGTAPATIFPLLQKTPLGPLTGGPLFTIVDHLAGLIVAYILFQAIYIIVPNQKIRFRYSWLGAVIAAVLLQLYIVFFPLYVSHFLTGIVAAIGSAVILLVFFYYFAVILFLGAEANAFFSLGVRPSPHDLATLVNISSSEEEKAT